MYVIENPNNMKPERSEALELGTKGFFFNVRLGGLADMVQVVNFVQWSLPKNGFTAKSVHFEDDLLEVHCVEAEDQADA